MLDCTADASVDVAGVSASTTIHVHVPSSCSIIAPQDEVIASHWAVNATVLVAVHVIFSKAWSKSNSLLSSSNHHAKTFHSFVGFSGFSAFCPGSKFVWLSIVAGVHQFVSNETVYVVSSSSAIPFSLTSLVGAYVTVTSTSSVIVPLTVATSGV